MSPGVEHTFYAGFFNHWYQLAWKGLAWFSPYLPKDLSMLFGIAIETSYSIYVRYIRPKPNEMAVVDELIKDFSKVENKIAIVTGLDSDLGVAIIDGLARAGFQLHIPVNNMAKGKFLIEPLQARYHQVKFILYKADISEPSDVKKFVAEFKMQCNHLDLLLIDAATGYSRAFYPNRSNIDYSMTINCIAPYLLATMLKDRLEAGNLKRIVNVGSMSYCLESGSGPENFFGNTNATSFFSNAKYVQLLSMNQLAMDWKATGITINTLHPGILSSYMFLARGPLTFVTLMAATLYNIFSFVFMIPEQSALQALWLCLSEDVAEDSGKLFFDFYDVDLSSRFRADLKAGNGIAIIAYLQMLTQRS